MEALELERRRRQMGESIQDWGATAEVGDGYWVALMGMDSPDANVALLSASAPSVAARVLELIKQADVPALVLLAGDAAEIGLPSPWQPVGSMPFMAGDLAAMALATDVRVRQATLEDLDTMTQLMSDAYGIEPEVARGCISATFNGKHIRMWLLENDGVPVSCCMTARHEDVVSVWCMSTPERFGRRGYGRAVLAHALAEARTDGAQIGLLGATPAGEPLYQSTGWESVEQWTVLAATASAQFE
jgi:N-acetylglutamate synthase-like GNAT family acetyltransferase